MTFSFNKIQRMRTLFVILSAVLFLQAVVTFFSFFSTPTDENWFRNGPTPFMAVKNFPAEPVRKQPAIGGHPLSVKTSVDSVLTGDLLLSINNGTVKTVKDVYEAIGRSPQDEIRFDILRPSLNYIITFKVKRSSIPPDFIALLPNYAFVTDVIAGGASDRSGMKVGDLIMRINEQDFTNANEADRILRLGQIGKSLKYDILRNNHFMQLNIVLAKFGIPVTLLIFTLCGIVWMLTGTFILVSRPNLKAARLVGSALLLIGFFIATLVIRRDFIMTTEVIIRQVMIGAAYILGTAFFFHSMHYFPIDRSDLAGRPWIIRGYYIFTILSTVLSIVFNSPLPVAMVMIYGLFVLIKYRKSVPPEYKRFSTIIRWTVIVVGGSSILLIYLFRDSFQTLGIGLLGIVLTLIPISYLYTIGRYHLLDMKLRVRRNTQYSIATILWGGLIFYGLVWTFFQLPMLDLPKMNIVFTGTAIEVNDAPELSSQRGTSERVLLMVLAIVLTVVVMRVRKYGQQFIDKKYFRQQYDYRRASFELGEILATTLNADDLARKLVKKFSELMKLKRAGVLFFRDEQCCSCLSVHGFDGTAWGSFCIAHERELIAGIRQFQNEFRIDYLPVPLKDEFNREGFHYGVPIRSKEKLIGVLLIGEKQSETTFRQEDLAFLSSTAKQASASIENAFLYEELAEKERMKHELQIARRIQLDSLPQTTPEVDGLDISGTSIPAMEVGGDFFDYLTNGNGKMTIVIGDVSGKGTSAALYMSKVQGILRSLHGFDLSPKDLFNRANTLLCKDLEKRSFVTVLGAEFNTEKKSVIVSRAGHLPLLHYDAAAGTVRKVLPRGLGLGLNDASVFTSEMEEKKLHYSSGDIFLFATDGVTEARNADGDYGEERLLQILNVHHKESAKTIQTILLDELSVFAGQNDQHDDQTVVVVKAA